MAYDAGVTITTRDELLEAVARSLEQHGSQVIAGIESIEHKAPGHVLKTAVEGTIFGWIAEALYEQGVQGDLETVGGTLTALGISASKDQQMAGFTHRDVLHQAAHQIGCHCHGAEISGDDAADRVRARKTTH